MGYGLDFDPALDPAGGCDRQLWRSAPWCFASLALADGAMVPLKPNGIGGRLAIG